VVQLRSAASLHLQQHLVHQAVAQVEAAQQQQQTAVRRLARPLLLQRRRRHQQLRPQHPRVLQARVLQLPKQQQLARVLRVSAKVLYLLLLEALAMLLRLCWQLSLQHLLSLMLAVQKQSRRTAQQQQ
jgi:hypothetical protein